MPLPSGGSRERYRDRASFLVPGTSGTCEGNAQQRYCWTEAAKIQSAAGARAL